MSFTTFIVSESETTCEVVGGFVCATVAVLAGSWLGFWAEGGLAPMLKLMRGYMGTCCCSGCRDCGCAGF